MQRLTTSILALTLLAAQFGYGANQPRNSVNSIRMTLVQIEPGKFEMGVDSVPLPPALTKGIRNVSYDRPDGNGDYDEVPVHTVTITQPLLIGQTEITIEQFQRFRPEYQGNKDWAPYAAGISWNDAVAFCDWLSRKEGKPYRLPTEAEWEYACRAGTRTPFSGGMQPDDEGVASPWGVKNMQAGLPEWCSDWWGKYPGSPQVDPIGPASGIAKIVRGGGLDVSKRAAEYLPAQVPYYRRSANRASAAADFASPSGHIGFRVVQAEMPKTEPWTVEPNFFSTAIKQNAPDLKIGPDPAKPYYHTRELFPDLDGRDMREVGWKIGMPRGLGQAYHNSAVQICANGDLVAAYYNTQRYENDIDQSILTMRLRYGSDEWDIPEPWPDFADAADAAPVFWNDGAKMWLFWGCPLLIGGPPFQYMTSVDNGASWSAPRTPVLQGPVGEFTPQPINSVVKTADGTIFLPVDGNGSTAVLFATSDDGKIWRDTGGRTAGRHTSIILGKDGSIVGYGGKNSNIDGFMPLSVTKDGGKTYETSKTQFLPLAGGQRPSVIRLRSGRIFFVADSLSSKEPGGRESSFVALSDDEGQTWHRRDLPIASTCGYVTATQTPNGVIQVVTSKTQPVALQIELNEAWILQGGDASTDDGPLHDVRTEKELYPSGKLKAQWSGGISAANVYCLDGPQVFYYSNGAKQWESTYAGGRKIGTETLWASDGKKKWERIFGPGSTWTWRVYDESGKVSAESKWRGKTLIEP